MDRALLNVISTKTYSTDPAEREEQVKNDLATATLTKGKRPSVETSITTPSATLRDHLHPTLVTDLCAARKQK
jgi:hypothetical protein